MIAFAHLLAAGLAGATTDSVSIAPRAAVEYSGEGLRWMGPLPPSTPFDSASVRRGLERMVDSAVAQGFLSAEAAALEAVATDSGMSLKIRAASGGRLVWNRLLDAGSSRTTPTALARLGRLPAGKPADPRDLDAVLARLEMTGYVKRKAPPRIRRVPNSARADAVLFLSDVPSSFVEAAASWTRSEDPKGYAEARLANIAGTARDLEFGISQGEQGIAARIHHKEPWIGPYQARLDLEGRLANDSASSVWEASAEIRWPFLDGKLEIGAGLSTARRAERLPGDTVFGPVSREYGSRLLVSGRSSPPAPWPRDETSGELAIEAATSRSDSGDGTRLRLRGNIDLWRSFGRLTARTAVQGRLVLPLDRSVGLSEALAPGGIALWRGWPEGSPRSPAWSWIVLQAGTGNDDGGAFLFWEPGVRALRRQDLSWSPEWGWSLGAGTVFQTPSWRIDLVVAAREATESWQDALLQVRARNRF